MLQNIKEVVSFTLIVKITKNGTTLNRGGIKMDDINECLFCGFMGVVCIIVLPIILPLLIFGWIIRKFIFYFLR